MKTYAITEASKGSQQTRTRHPGQGEWGGGRGRSTENARERHRTDPGVPPRTQKTVPSRLHKKSTCKPTAATNTGHQRQRQSHKLSARRTPATHRQRTVTADFSTSEQNRRYDGMMPLKWREKVSFDAELFVSR